jgi:DNA polymerase alpha subunit A
VVENIHEYLRTLASQMREFSVPTQKYIIHTQLGKAPQEYPNAGSMPSVQVALKQMAKGKHVKAKDVMSFIITGESGGSAENAAKNAFPVDDVIKPDSILKPDIDYYLHKQILPPVERLCAPISGTNVTQLADCLGLDTSKYRVTSANANGNANDAEIQPLESQIPDSVRFKDALPVHLRCRMCKSTFSFRGILPATESTSENDREAIISHDGLACPNSGCGKIMPNISLVAQMESQIRQHVSRFYANVLVCDDPSCGARTRQMSVYGHRCLGPKGLGHGCLGKMHPEYTEKMLYNQLLFLNKLFDVDNAKVKAEKEAREGRIAGEKKQKISVLADVNRERWETVRGVVKAYLEKNGRQWVQMDSLFGFALKVV